MKSGYYVLAEVDTMSWHHTPEEKGQNYFAVVELSLPPRSQHRLLFPNRCHLCDHGLARLVRRDNRNCPCPPVKEIEASILLSLDFVRLSLRR